MAARAIPSYSGTSDTFPTLEDGSCPHCRRQVLKRSATWPFCCEGCRTVRELLLAGGFERYYDLRGSERIPPPDLSEPRRSRAWLDAELETLRNAGGDLATLEVDLAGIHCAACVWLIEESFRRQPGAAAITVNPLLGRMRATFEPQRFAAEQWIDTVESFGYRFRPRGSAPRPESHGLLVRFGVVAALALQGMLFGFAFHFGLSKSDGEIYSVLSLLSLGISTTVVLVGGQPFFRSAWQGLRHRLAHLDLPIAVGIVLVFGISLVQWWKGEVERAFFDTLNVFIALMLGGRLLERRALEKNRGYLLGNETIGSLPVRRLRDRRRELVAGHDVVAGDRLLIAPGEWVPVRGRIVGPAGQISREWITGESVPEAVAVGETLEAGSLNTGSVAFEVEALEPFETSRLAELFQFSETRATPSRGPARFWDLASRYWIAVVFLLGILGFSLWIPAGIEQALAVTAALLVVTCPCAIGIAIPLARQLTMARLREAGCFVRNEGVLDRVGAVAKVVFDKTGTLTLPIPAASNQMKVESLSLEAAQVAYNLALRSRHPKAQSLLEVLEARGATYEADWIVIERVGFGSEATIASKTWRLGRATWAAPGAGREGTLLSCDGIPILELAEEEAERPGIRRLLEGLAGRGFELWIFSGDRCERVETLARTLGFPTSRSLGELSPERKAQLLEQLDRGDTLYLGDGVNDLPAFRTALLAGAPPTEAPAVPSRSDFFLHGPSLEGLEALFEEAGVLAVQERQLLFASLIYNAFAVSGALAGWITPLLAALIMPLSSLGLVARTGWWHRSRGVLSASPHPQLSLPSEAS